MVKSISNTPEQQKAIDKIMFVRRMQMSRGVASCFPKSGTGMTTSEYVREYFRLNSYSAQSRSALYPGL